MKELAEGQKSDAQKNEAQKNRRAETTRAGSFCQQRPQGTGFRRSRTKPARSAHRHHGSRFQSLSEKRSFVARQAELVRAHPESAQWKKGKVVLEFFILKNGGVAGLKVVGSSGDAAMDRPAYGSITGSNPFPPLPRSSRARTSACASASTTISIRTARNSAKRSHPF